MKARHKRARRQRRLAPRRAMIKRWHDDLAAVLADAMAQGVTLPELNAAMRQEREMVEGEMEAFLLTPERFVE